MKQRRTSPRHASKPLSGSVKPSPSRKDYPHAASRPGSKVKRTSKAKASAMLTVVATASNLPPCQTFTHSPYFSSSSSSTAVPLKDSASKNLFAAKEEAEETSKDLVPRTKSFGALWAGNYGKVNDPSITVHTLILGTHPSVISLDKQEYYGHPLNAFWWIVGDCLGFRRASGRNKSGDGYYQLVSDLRYGENEIIPYEDQMAVLLSKGFAMWDIVQSCHRPGSLDSDITDELPNDIFGFCQQHPTIERIVFSNGATGCKIFNKHFREWWKSGELVAYPGNDESLRAFKSVSKLRPHRGHQKRRIECISALSVSPAAARYSFAEKRDFWDRHVYTPGLARHSKREPDAFSLSLDQQLGSPPALK